MLTGKAVQGVLSLLLNYIFSGICQLRLKPGQSASQANNYYDNPGFKFPSPLFNTMISTAKAIEKLIQKPLFSHYLPGSCRVPDTIKNYNF
jgi:hypothetical protein